MGGPDACAALFGECLSALVHLSSQDVGPAEAATSKASVDMSPVVHVEPERAAVMALPWAGVTVGLAVLEAVSNCPLSSASPPTVHTRDNRHNLHCSKVARFVCTLMLCFVRRGVTLGPMASAHPQPQTLLPQLRPLAQMMTQTTRWGSQVQPLRPARQRPCTLCERHWRLPHRVRKPLHAGSTGVLQEPHIGKSAGPTALQARRPCKLFVRHWTLPWPHHPLPHQPQRGAALNPPRL